MKNKLAYILMIFMISCNNIDQYYNQYKAETDMMYNIIYSLSVKYKFSITIKKWAVEKASVKLLIDKNERVYSSYYLNSKGESIEKIDDTEIRNLLESDQFMTLFDLFVKSKYNSVAIHYSDIDDCFFSYKKNHNILRADIYDGVLYTKNKENRKSENCIKAINDTILIFSYPVME